MTQLPFKQNKNKSFLLSEQVKSILKEKGFSKVFNYNDYNYFKKSVKDVFNKAFTIAELFIKENEQENQSDFNEYIF